MLSLNTLFLATAIFGLLFLLFAFRKKSQSLTLDHFETLCDQDLPGLSIVIAAKDEAKTIGPALDSLLNLDYPDLEIIFVDDRSTDETYQIATRKAAQHKMGHRLKVTACRELPQGWLGKVHALSLGVEKSSKDLILLTDADVIFESGSLRRAISAQQVLACDHLVVAPLIETRGFWEPVLVSYFLLMFAVKFNPTDVHRKKKRYVGVGAFNLLTSEAMERCGNLEPVRLQVTDDVHLGRLVKSRGLTQYCVIAEDKIKVRWFEGLSGCILGLEKNAYAGVNYDPIFSLLVLPFMASPLWLPIALACFGHGAWALAYYLFLILVGSTIPESCRIPKWVGLSFPLASAVITYTFARSAILAELRQEIVWRDTRYDLALLRKEQLRFLNEVAPL